MLKKILLVCTLVALPAPAFAATMARAVSTGIGPRVGFSSSPDQFVVGGQLVIGEVAPSLTFDPSLEVGLGDHLTAVGFNFDLHYHFETRTAWRPSDAARATRNGVIFEEPGFVRRPS